MRLQRAQGNWPDARLHVVVGQRHPVLQAAARPLAHGRRHLGFALEAVCPELGNSLPGRAQHMAMRRQDEINAVRVAGLLQPIQRIQVGGHFAVGRANDGGAAVEDVVARKKQTVFDQHQADMVGGVAGRKNYLQCVRLRMMGQR